MRLCAGGTLPPGPTAGRPACFPSLAKADAGGPAPSLLTGFSSDFPKLPAGGPPNPT